MRNIELVGIAIILALLMLPVVPASAQQTNLALHKFASQSSTYAKNSQYGADKGVDGIYTSFFNTEAENNPWWQVDLGARYQLSLVRIYNRLDFADRAKTLQVLLSDDGQNWRVVYSHDGKVFGGADGKYLDIPLNNIARFVRVQLRANEYLNLVEVEVYGVVASQSGYSTGNSANQCDAACKNAGYQGWTGQMQGSQCVCTARNTGNSANQCDAACKNAGYQGWTGQMQGSNCVCTTNSAGNSANQCDAACKNAGYQRWTGQMQGSKCVCASESPSLPQIGSSYEYGYVDLPSTTYGPSNGYDVYIYL